MQGRPGRFPRKPPSGADPGRLKAVAAGETEDSYKTLLFLFLLWNKILSWKERNRNHCPGALAKALVAAAREQKTNQNKIP